MANQGGSRRTMNSRQKGKRGEREWAAWLREHMGCEHARRGQQYNGAEGEDVLDGFDVLHHEVKRVERLNIYEAMRQSIRDAKPGRVPIVAHRRNGDQWLVTIRASDMREFAAAIRLMERSRAL